MKIFKVLGILTALLAGAPTISYAQLAYTSNGVNLRAGPAVEYPVVAILPAGMPISVEGCLSDYRWCDVVAGPNRGWVYAGNIVYPYQGANVPVLTYGAVIGLGVLAFSVGNYWDNHYRGRPWYSQRQVWIDRPRAGFGAGGRRPPPQGPVVRPGGQRPPQGQVPGGGQRPPQGQVPGGGQRAPQGQVPGGGQRAPQGQVPSGGQRAPQGQRSSDGKRPQQDQGPGGR
jgi:uncharacterized protein YraI